MKIMFLTITLFVAGCATSSGISKLGPDTYRMSSYYSVVRGGTAAAQADVLNSAGSYCENMGKEVLVKNTQKLFSYNANAYTGFEAIFQCLDKNDTTLQRPTYEQAPSVVIKNEIKYQEESKRQSASD